MKRSIWSPFTLSTKKTGYGTTVNYSIAHATGEYFKLLDGDDWFDKERAKELIRYLAAANRDVVVGSYCMGPDREHLRTVKGGEGEAKGTFSISDIKKPDGIGM